MTALNIATDIPSSIDTLEKLMVWGGNCLWNLNSDVNAVEGDNFSQRAASSNTFYIASTNKTQHISRQSIEMNPDYQIGGSKPFSYALPISNKPLTAAMKSN